MNVIDTRLARVSTILTEPTAGNPGVKETVEELHEWFGNAVLILAAFHAAAALFHRFVLKEDVLRRMLPERVRR